MPEISNSTQAELIKHIPPAPLTNIVLEYSTATIEDLLNDPTLRNELTKFGRFKINAFMKQFGFSLDDTINKQDDRGRTMLMHAAHGQTLLPKPKKVVEALIGLTADITIQNNCGDTALDYAVNSSLNIMKVLLNANAMVTSKSLSKTIERSNHIHFRYLLKSTQSPKPLQDIINSSQNGLSYITTFLKKEINDQYYGFELIYTLAGTKNNTQLNYLSSLCKNKEQTITTAAYLAAEQDETEKLNDLTNLGANLGWVAQWAVEKRDLHLLKSLDKAVIKRTLTPLLLSALNNTLITDYLLTHFPIDYNAITQNKENPLIAARKGKHYQAMTLMLIHEQVPKNLIQLLSTKPDRLISALEAIATDRNIGTHTKTQCLKLLESIGIGHVKYPVNQDLRRALMKSSHSFNLFSQKTCTNSFERLTALHRTLIDALPEKSTTSSPELFTSAESNQPEVETEHTHFQSGEGHRGISNNML